MTTYHNPIVKGFHPDPSICRKDSGFYLVTSTFEYFPGVPLYRSGNLVNWELTGHCLTTSTQLPLQGCGASGGIYAPTIRYHDGIFYMTATNVSSIRNFIVYTSDPTDVWSNPVAVDQGGIDPSLFFDDDGKVYYTSTAQDQEGRDGIQMCEINPLTGEKLTDSVFITDGCGGCYPEGPHIYKRKGFYYLLLAEGGTEYGHHAVMMRSQRPWGPYEASPYNPFISHGNLLGKSPIQAVGHADLTEDENGNWWMVCLGIRTAGYNLLHNLGRETFLAPVIWREDGWPEAGNHGTVSLEMSAELPGAFPKPVPAVFFDGFDAPKLKPDWTFLRNPEPDCARIDPAAGCLLVTGWRSLSEPCCSPGFVGVRQQEYQMRASVFLKGNLTDGQRAGLTAYYSSDYHYEIYLARERGIYYIGVNRRIHDLECEVFRQLFDYSGEVQLFVTCDKVHYHFGYRHNEAVYQAASGLLAGLCTEGTARMTFTGTFIGLFSDGGTARFDDFEMENLKLL